MGNTATLEMRFTLTAQTVFVGGTAASLVRGAKVSVTLHFDKANSDIVYADKIQFK
jgi:hypothetical protein